MKLSVVVMSYNFESYLADCIQSIINQKINFEFEILIGDDASTDNSEKIINQFAANYPNIIKPVLHSKNIGAINNYFYLLKLAKGEYIAYIDGDDYMLPNKLFMQVNFLDDNLDCSMVVHPCKVLTSHSEEECEQKIKTTSVDINYLLKHGLFFSHSSKMFRKKLITNLVFPRTVSRHPDYLLHIQSALKGRIGYINEYLGCYRINPLGMSSQNDNFVHKIYFEKIIMANYIRDNNDNLVAEENAIVLFESANHYSTALKYIKSNKLRFLFHIRHAKETISRKTLIKKLIAHCFILLIIIELRIAQIVKKFNICKLNMR